MNGHIVPLNPTTASVLKKFEPMMLPSTKSFCPFRAEAMADANSGSDVPAAQVASAKVLELGPEVFPETVFQEYPVFHT